MSRRYEIVWRTFINEPLAIDPAKLAQIRAFLELKIAGDDVDPEQIAAVVAGREDREARFNAIQGARRGDGTIQVGNTAILPVMGILSQRIGAMEAMSGGVGAEQIGASLDRLMADKSVRKVILAVDSPGGSVYGITELGKKIREAGAQKKIVGLADSVAASAAFWLITQASEVFVTPGGQIGSVGVIVQHEDSSKAEELAGTKTTNITSAPHKAETLGPLSDEARGELQKKVDAYHALFVSDVAKGRNVTEAKVNRDFGGGRMLLAKAAVEAGMADGVATMEQLLRRMGADAGPDGARAEGDGLSVAAKNAMARARARVVEVQAD